MNFSINLFITVSGNIIGHKIKRHFVTNSLCLIRNKIQTNPRKKVKDFPNLRINRTLKNNCVGETVKFVLRSLPCMVRINP